MAYDSHQSLSENNCFIDATMNDAYCKNSYRLVILGAPKVGKSCILNWFLGKNVDHNYVPTIEDFHKKVYKIRGEVYRLDILDTSGNDPFPAMKKLNIMTGDLFILAFAIDNIDSYLQVKQLFQLIIELKKSKQDTNNKQKNGNCNSVPILILGNKLDYLTENKISSRCTDLNEIQQFFSTCKSAIYREISATNTIGLDTAFEKLFSIANLPLEMLPSRHRTVDMSLDFATPKFTKTESLDLPPNSPNSVCNSSGNNEISTTSNLISHTRTSSLKFRKLNSKEPEIKEIGLKLSAVTRKSFRKTFRRPITDSWGAVWLNARRPSIRAELKLLQIKKNPTFKYHDYEKNSTSKIANRNAGNQAIGNNCGGNGFDNCSKTKFQSLIDNMRNLLCCSTKRNSKYL